MMKTSTRVLSAALAAVLVAASFPIEASAAVARLPAVAETVAAAIAAPAARVSAPLSAAATATAAPLAAPVLPPAAVPARAAGVPAAAAERPAAGWRAAEHVEPAALFDGVRAAAHDSPEEAVPAGGDRASEARDAAALKKSIAVGLSFAAVEYAGGVMTGTLALKADALHLASDRAVDASALLAKWIGRRFGRGKMVEAGFALTGSVALAAMGLAMIPETARAFLHPAPAAGWGVVGFAALSAASNMISAALLKDHQHDLGSRGAFLHALNDAYGTLGVMAAASVSLVTGKAFLMPFATAAVVTLVLRVAWEIGRPAAGSLLAGDMRPVVRR